MYALPLVIIFHTYIFYVVFSITSTTEVPNTCRGGNEGSISVQTSGGEAPAEFSIKSAKTFVDYSANFFFQTLYAGEYLYKNTNSGKCI